MKGVWIWPSEAKGQERVLRRIIREDELVPIILELAKHPEGLSNAQIDKLLSNNSQWRTLPHMEELLALAFVEYRVQFFGDSGKYALTELGKAIVVRIQALTSNS